MLLIDPHLSCENSFSVVVDDLFLPQVPGIHSIPSNTPDECGHDVSNNS